MKSYSYNGKDISGVRSGTIEADSRSLAVKKLKSMGLIEWSLHQVKPFSSKSIYQWLSLLDVLLQQNIKLADAVELLKRQSRKDIKDISNSISSDIKNGKQFFQSLISIQRDISPAYLAILNVSEATGNLPKAISQVVQHQSLQEEQKKQLWAQMSYPLFLIIVLMVCFYALLDVVAPSLKQAFGEREISNWASRLVFSLSGRANEIYQGLTIIFAFSACLVWLVTRSKTGSDFVSKLRFVKYWNSKIQSNLVLEVISLAMINNVPVQKASTIAEEMAKSHFLGVISMPSLSISDELREGKDLAIVLRGNGIITEEEYELLCLGANEQGLKNSLEKLVKLRNQKSRDKAERMKQFMGPILILLVGGMVAVFAFAILSPIMEMTQVINQ